VRSNVKNKSRQTSNDIHSGRGSAPKSNKRKFQSSAVQFLYDRYVGNDPKQIEAYEQEVLNAQIARKIHDLRTSAGLSQRELAERVGTSASAICRLEDADYEGHSLSLLKRIAEALDQRVEIRFVPAKKLRTLWHSLADVRMTFRDADAVEQWTIFNVKGNQYRLVAELNYRFGRIYIRHILTHAEYDWGTWKQH
jgi:mRNA-degrading endonuclease HigB of HigAB toxin-antitoxin module